MNGFRRWLPSAVLAVGCGSTFAQVPIEEPAIAAALPGGTVVGNTRGSVTTISSNAEPAAMPKTPPVAAPITPATPTVGSAPPPPPVLLGLPAEAPVNAMMSHSFMEGGNTLQGNNCCGPVGANGPIGEEVYARFGVTIPQGDTLLVRNLKRGQTAQIGARTQLFDSAGDAAWAIDAHVAYFFNRGTNGDIVTLETEPVTIHSLHRTAVGLGLGRDWFLFRPGFILDTWDANFRLGADVGGRWGAGHVNFDTPFEEGGYRRRFDVFAQAFGGLTATMEIPAGGWIWLVGGRLEADYTFSDFLDRQANFYQYSAMGMLGVRY